MFRPAKEVEYHRLIVAALSLPTLKYLCVDRLFKFKKSDIPKGMRSNCVDFDTSNIDYQSHSRIDFLCSIADLCAVPSLIRKLSVGLIFPECLCSLLANLNSSFESNHCLELEQLLIDIEPCYCKHLSHALRQDPAITRHSLRKSASLDDLTCATNERPSTSMGSLRQTNKQALVTHDYFARRPFSDHYHSCPDLLESRSFHILHPRMMQSLSQSIWWLSPIRQNMDER